MMRQLWSTMLGTLGAALLIAMPSAWAAPLLKVDFGEVKEDPVQPGFTEMAGSLVQPTANASFGSYSIDLAGGGFSASTWQVGNVDVNVRGLYRDYYYNDSTVNGEGIALAIGGVTANTQYNLTLWSYDPDQIFSETPTTWTPTMNTSGNTGNVTLFAIPRPTTLNDYSTTIQVTSTTNTLNVFGTTTSGFGGTRLNGLKLNDGSTDVLTIDFGQPRIAAPPPQAGYVAMTGLIGQTSAVQTIGAYTVSVDGQGFVNTSEANANDIDASVRDLYRGTAYNDSDANGVGITLTIEGVTPNAVYDVKLWSYDAAQFFSETATLWSPIEDTQGTSGTITNFATPRPTTLDDYSTVVRVHSSSNVLKLFGTTTSGFGGTRLNAFELALVVTGDLNGDGFVDIFDVNIVSDNWGSTGPAGDANGDGTVDIFDVNLISDNWLPGSGGAAAVPEPRSWILLALAGALGWRRVRRARRAVSS